jgi:peroxiredoxin (alkyl hydroperoxide reductase subunit C)
MGSLVGRKAPLFTAKAVKGGEIIEGFRLKDFLGRGPVVLFFYPKDFTFVCPTELHAFQSRLGDFLKRNVQIIACSTDTEYCHRAWMELPKAKGGIGGVSYPIVSDCNRVISEAYGVLAGEYADEDDGDDGVAKVDGEFVALRGLFIIDREGIVQHASVNNLSLGRSVDEVLRLVDALQFIEKNGQVCPANWHSGESALDPSAEGVAKYFSSPSAG